MMSEASNKRVSRRMALELLGALGAGLVAACGGSSTSGTTGSGAGGGAGGSGSTGTGGSTASTTSGSTTGWATGDGAFLQGKDYGNPFAAGVGAACAVYEASTEGPCHSNTFHRQDITDGLVGLPTRLELVVVDKDCQPIPDAIVEIWHCSPLGVYSAAKEGEGSSDIGYASNRFSDLNEQFCTGGDAEGEANGWLRGYQKAGADGRVTFDTVFPGWYASRTVHIHFIVTVGQTSYITSQLFFDDALNDEIIADHAKYNTRGKKDTTNASDNVAKGLTLNDVLMTYEQQSDGALLAWKAIAINA